MRQGKPSHKTSAGPLDCAIPTRMTEISFVREIRKFIHSNYNKCHVFSLLVTASLLRQEQVVGASHINPESNTDSLRAVNAAVRPTLHHRHVIGQRN